MKPRSSVCSSEPAESSESDDRTHRHSWQEQEAGATSLRTQGDDPLLSCQPRIRSLADAERLFDELTQEKQQVIVGYILLLYKDLSFYDTCCTLLPFFWCIDPIHYTGFIIRPFHNIYNRQLKKINLQV